MKILVTGGAGYLGSLLIPKLLDAGHRVRLYDCFRFGIQPILHFAAHPHLEIIDDDVRNAEAVKKAVVDADVIMHLAAIVGYPACSADPLLAKTINLDGTTNVAAAASPSQLLIFASTGSTYGKVEGVCDESTAIAPLTLYGATKSEGEKMMLDKNAVALRFATVFGVSPRLRLDLLVNDFVHQALHQRQIILYEGYFRRTFLHVADAARAFIWAMEEPEKKQGMPFNIGNETMNYTTRKIAMMLRDKVDYYLHEADVAADLDKRDYEVSYQRARALGYEPEIDMNAGLDELISVLRHVKVASPWRNA